VDACESGFAAGKGRITRFFGEAYSKAASVATAINSFKAAGIWPVNPAVIKDNEFAPSDVTKRPLSAVQLFEVQSLESSRDNATDVEPLSLSVPQMEADNGAEADVSPLPSRTQSERRPIKAASICPIPVRSRPINQRRATLGATLLTSLPYKSSLEEKLGKIKNEKNCCRKSPKANKISRTNKQKVKATSEARQTWFKNKDKSCSREKVHFQQAKNT